MQQLLDIITEKGLKLVSCILNTVDERSGTLLQQSHAVFQHSLVLLGDRVKGFALFKELDRRLGHLGKIITEEVSSPLDTVDRLLWEHLHSADGDVLIFFGVFLLAIGLGDMWQNDLHVAFRS